MTSTLQTTIDSVIAVADAAFGRDTVQFAAIKAEAIQDLRE
jgi:hypothetical protein